MPQHFTQQTLKYERHEEDIAEVARAIDHLACREYDAALSVLMALRNHWQDAQQPRVVDFNPQAEQRT